MEYGDYQTPSALAEECCRWIDCRPASLLEPTCGVGNFLEAALKHFPGVERAVGIEINREYAAEAGDRLHIPIEVADVFTVDWGRLMSPLPDPLLVIGNPPWVTNSRLGAAGSANLPLKENVHRWSGIEAITGRSNFDISEWILLRMFEQMNGRHGTVAMLCKTVVARKSLCHAWKNGMQTGAARIISIDASKHFSASVDACLLICHFAPDARDRECKVENGQTIGYRDGELIADLRSYHSHLRGPSTYRWRSGIKHDCAKVMEFRLEDGVLRNGFGERVDIEEACVYALCKSSDVGNGSGPSRWVLVPQKRTAEDTATLEYTAPKTWAYLQRHAEALAARASAIYKHRPPFSVFGVGDYSFSRWKVAISGFYKTLKFRVIAPLEDRPVMLDDTVYFLPCQSQQEAERLAILLNSEEAQSFFRARIFWDAKRPITVSLLSQLAIERLVTG